MPDEPTMPDSDLPTRLAALAARLRSDYDPRPVTQAEWDGAVGDNFGTPASAQTP